jgi:putative peptidoglycan lipid II flippase
MLEHPIIAVAGGVVLGGFVQFFFQVPSFWKQGYSLKPAYDFGHTGLKKMALLIMPATMGMAVAQINIFVSTILASYLPEGSVTYLYYSMRLIQFPVGIFGVAMAMAVLPTLSEHAVKGDYDELRNDFSFALRLIFFITVPAMAGLIALREPIVNLLFQRGRFDYAATVGTAQALLFYSIGIWSIVGVRTVTVSFYSMQDTKTPVKIAAISVAANLLFSIALMNSMKHSGLALANSIASGINFIMLFYFLRKRLVRVEGKRILSSFLKTALASLIMGIIGSALLHGELWSSHGNTVLKIFSLGGTIVLCTMVYIVITYIIKSEECSYMIGMVKQKIRH